MIKDLNILQINELLVENKSTFVQINNAFTLEDSIDKNFIIEITNIEVDWEDCFKVTFKCHPEYYVYNNKVAKKDWYNNERKATLNWFEFNHKYFDPSKQIIEDNLYVMETDLCFDLLEEEDFEKYSNKIESNVVVKNDKQNEILIIEKDGETIFNGNYWDFNRDGKSMKNFIEKLGLTVDYIEFDHFE